MLICLYRALTSENPTQQHFPLTEEAFTTLHPPLAQKGIIIEELGCSPITSELLEVVDFTLLQNDFG